MRRVSAIVLAAGKGERFGSAIPKPLVKVATKPIIIYSLQALAGCSFVKDIVVVVNAQNSEEIIKSIKRYRISKVARVVFGGRRRQDSVGNGLKVLGYGSELVLIHDSARPFIDRRMIQETIRKAEKCGAAIVGVPVKATIKKVTKTLRGCYRVKETIDRSNLWEIQTPQVFEKDLILKAYKKFGNIDVTDDAMLAEKLGAKVSVVFGSYDNIKITTPQDLVTAQAIAKKIR